MGLVFFIFVFQFQSWEVVNTAVLDGKQVSRPMKVFIVSRAGQVADVTLQASCRSLDESVLKVSLHIHKYLSSPMCYSIFKFLGYY